MTTWTCLPLTADWTHSDPPWPSSQQSSEVSLQNWTLSLFMHLRLSTKSIPDYLWALEKEVDGCWKFSMLQHFFRKTFFSFQTVRFVFGCKRYNIFHSTKLVFVYNLSRDIMNFTSCSNSLCKKHANTKKHNMLSITFSTNRTYKTSFSSTKKAVFKCKTL